MRSSTTVLSPFYEDYLMPQLLELLLEALLPGWPPTPVPAQGQSLSEGKRMDTQRLHRLISHAFGSRCPGDSHKTLEASAVTLLTPSCDLRHMGAR